MASEPLSRCLRCGITKHKSYPCWTCRRMWALDDERERHSKAALNAGLAQESERRRIAARELLRRTDDGLADGWDYMVPGGGDVPAPARLG